ncbi:MAG: Asp23/Gls24 family envelope stress response protein [Clostridiales bacterium]|nr:Asp23/Gls24 family envelope stress response protein [Clostridiales bacterium]
MQMKNSKGVGGLIITEEVIAKMSSTAAMEVAGVAGMAFQPLDKTRILSKVLPPKAVRVSTKDGEIVIDVFIAVKRDIRITDIAEAVQKNVKETVQNMTGSVVSKVNVHVSDIELAEEAAAE